MWRSVPKLALAASLLLPSSAIAGEARAVMQVGITITGKDPRSAAEPKAGQKSAVQPAAKSPAK